MVTSRGRKKDAGATDAVNLDTSLLSAAECRARESICGICGKKLHFSRVCRCTVPEDKDKLASKRVKQKSWFAPYKGGRRQRSKEDLMFEEYGLQWISAQERCTIVNTIETRILSDQIY